MTAAEKLLGRADRYLVSASALLDLGDHESAVSRAYYAMFYTARAVLGVRGVTATTHSGVVSEFGRVFVRTEDVEREHLAALGRALNDRLLAEYDEDLTFSRAQAERVVASAEAFVREVRHLAEPA